MFHVKHKKPSPVGKVVPKEPDRAYPGMNPMSVQSIKAWPLEEGAAKPGIECLEEA